MHKNGKGFTLLELLVVIAIIGILAAVVLASLSGARKNALITAEKQTLDQMYKTFLLYQLEVKKFPPGNRDVCSKCVFANQSLAKQRWRLVTSAVRNKGLGDMPETDQWGMSYAYDTNYPDFPNFNYYTYVCSSGPDNILQTDSVPKSNPRPEAKEDDICVFFK